MSRRSAAGSSETTGTPNLRGSGKGFEGQPLILSRNRWPSLERPMNKYLCSLQKIAESRGGLCLSGKYINSKAKLKWQCREGHVWEATPDNIAQGKWCPYCAGRKQTIKDMIQLAERKGGECLSKEYVSGKTKLKWKCTKGHIWKATPSNVKSGSWCSICGRQKAADLRRGTLEEMQRVAGSRNGRCLSEEYVDSLTKLTWQCEEGHLWEATPGNIKQGKWCPYCGGTHVSSIEEIRSLALKRGGKCLSSKYVNKRTKLKWRCKEGHIWDAPADSIKSGHWCPVCGIKKRSDAQRGTLEEIQQIAEERGGRCLSKHYVGSHRKLGWQCAAGHIWEAEPSHIKNGTWCPECAAGIGERICRAFFEQLFGKKFPKARPIWLRSQHNTQLELDGYCRALGMAFEYQGVQHYRYVEFFHGKTDEFEKRKDLDQIKRRLCASRGVNLLEVPEIPHYLSLVQLKQFLKKECERLGVAIPTAFDRTTVNLRAAYSPSTDDLLRELQGIAKRRGGELLSKTYLGGSTKLSWRCKNGHVWKAIPGSVKQGRWCRKCSYVQIADAQRGSIDDCRKLAKGKGGRCLSKTYVNVESKLKWQCEEGHTWEAKPNNIKHGQWCPVCGRKKRADTQRGTLEAMQKVAASRGGRCLSTAYVNSQTKLKWRCSEGHSWTATPADVKRGTWCPVCAAKKRGDARRGTLEAMQRIAASRGGKCLSSQYVSNHTKVKWECKDGHSWTATPANVKRGTWCPVCARLTKRKKRGQRQSR